MPSCLAPGGWPPGRRLPWTAAQAGVASLSCEQRNCCRIVAAAAAAAARASGVAGLRRAHRIVEERAGISLGAQAPRKVGARHKIPTVHGLRCLASSLQCAEGRQSSRRGAGARAPLGACTGARALEAAGAWSAGRAPPCIHPPAPPSGKPCAAVGRVAVCREASPPVSLNTVAAAPTLTPARRCRLACASGGGCRAAVPLGGGAMLAGWLA